MSSVRFAESPGEQSPPKERKEEKKDDKADKAKEEKHDADPSNDKERRQALKRRASQLKVQQKAMKKGGKDAPSDAEAEKAPPGSRIALARAPALLSPLARI